jgi:hypothetical protein
MGSVAIKLNSRAKPTPEKKISSILYLFGQNYLTMGFPRAHRLMVSSLSRVTTMRIETYLISPS